MAAITFRRTAGARLTPLLVAAAAAVALVTGGGWPPTAWTLGAAAVLALAVAGAVLALGDEVVADDAGLRLRNRLLGRERAVAWDDIEGVRVVSRRTGGARVVFVFPRRGRRVVLDALQDLDRLAALVQARGGGSGSRPL